MRLLAKSFLALLIVASPALADDVACDDSCPSGKVLVSFADGNNSHCFCQDAGNPMEDTADAPINCVDPEDDGSCE